MWSYYVFRWDLTIWSQTHHGGFGTRCGVVMHFCVSQRRWRRQVYFCGVAMQNGGYQLRAHPTQLRVTRHRVGCDDTQKRWVWPRDLYFWGLGCCWWTFIFNMVGNLTSGVQLKFNFGPLNYNSVDHSTFTCYAI
jgi:hypothetical protein